MTPRVESLHRELLVLPLGFYVLYSLAATFFFMPLQRRCLRDQPDRLRVAEGTFKLCCISGAVFVAIPSFLMLSGAVPFRDNPLVLLWFLAALWSVAPSRRSPE